jgi:replicative DNA helicase
MESPRTPPAAPQAEAALISALLQAPSVFDRISRLVRAPDFYRLDTRELFATIAALAEAGKPFDAVVVAEAIASAGKLDAIGGKAGYLAIAQTPATPENARGYARLITEASRRRALIAAALSAIEAAHTRPMTEDDSDDIAAEMANAADEIIRHDEYGGFQPTRGLLGKVIEGIEQRFNGQRRPVVPTGLHDLDHALSGGFEPSQLIILAARPGMGKSALAAQIAAHVAANTGPVGYFSLEMAGDGLMERLIANESRIKLASIRSDSADLEQEEWPRLTSAVNRLVDTPLFLNDCPRLTMTGLMSDCRRLKRDHGNLALVCIDYLGLMTPEGRAENKTQEIATLTRGLKLASMELKVPFLVLSQLNRGLENRTNKRPGLADLRESGSIEQDADICLFIYRDEVYNENSKEKGVAEIIIGKQRNGPIGTVRATWAGKYARFDNFIMDYVRAF